MAAASPQLNPVRLCMALFGALAVVAGIFMLPVSAQVVPSNALPFTRSYLLTGNYGVFGVDLPPQAADCTTFAPDCYAKGAITVTQCAKDGNGQPVFTPVGGCIPEGADVVAAWMYWEALAADPALVPKARLRPGQVGQYTTVLKARRNDEVLPNNASCLSSSGTMLTMSMFSADVLRFFPIQVDKDGVKTGRRQVVGTHDIALPEVGTGNNARQGAGATLFFVYRLESEPLRKVVVYDGAYLQQPPGAVTTQQLQGFYQSGPQSAWVTNIVGSGAKNTTERLLFSAAPVASVNDVVATDLFPFPLGNEGGNGSDRAWANPTVDVSTKMTPATSPSGFGETVSLAVDHGSSSPYECLSWAAVIFSTTVKDADADGLPDALELENGGLKDPDPADLVNTSTPVGRPLPYLWAMGARTGQRDVFIEMNGFRTEATTRYGDATAPFSTILPLNFVDIPAHNHLPTPAVIKLMGDALKSAPVPIHLHADVGDLGVYKKYAGFGSAEADDYLISSGARGGEVIAETFCNPNLQPNDPTPDPTIPNSLGCHFPFFPGTVGWRFGFEHYKNQAVDALTGAELSAGDQDECYATGSYTPDQGNPQPKACRRRFDPIRAGLFHYFLYAHALGMPKGKPCLDSNGNDADFNGTVSGAGVCSTPLTDNPNYHVPRSTSGAGDSPGGHGLITVGLWDLVNGVGSPFLVATTSVHEFGHNGDLSHGGRQVTWGNATTSTTFEPNCKPNYPSIMSYLFQIYGLLDLTGNARIDFSRGVYGDRGNAQTETTFLKEATLYDRFLLLPDASLTTPLRTAWFVPVVAPTFDQNNNQLTPGNLAYTIGVQPANRYCTGVKISGTNPSMGRFDGPGLSATPDTTSLIDWDLDVNTTTATQDVNFDGPNGAIVYQGYNDWANLRLNQLGGGRNPSGFSLGQGGFEFGQGGFDFGQGGFDFGQGGFDFGQGGFEFGQGGFDFGQGGFDFGQGGFDFGDGGFNLGQGGFDFGQGGFDFGQGGFDFGQGGFDFGNDITYDVVKQNGHTPPLSALASVIQTTGSTFHRNRVTWNAPNVGTVAAYKVFRQLGQTIDGSNPVEQLCSVNGVPAATPALPACTSATSFTDLEELPNDQWFTYFVRAVFSNCNPAPPANEKCESGPSNPTAVQAENNAPVVNNDPDFTTPVNTPLQIAARGVLVNDTDADSATSRIRVVTALTTQPASGTVVLNENGSFIYTPPTGFSGAVTFTYRADDGLWRNTQILMSPTSTNAATVTIVVGKGGGRK